MPICGLETMAARKTINELEREQRRAEIARLYLTGLPQWKIGKALNIDTSQVNTELATLRERWRAAAIRDFDELRSQEVAKIDQVEVEFWQAWERSKQAKQKTSTKRKTGENPSDEAGVVREESYGDPRFLDGVLKCVEKRCQLFGLNAPNRIVLDPAGKANYGPFLTDEERLARLAEFLNAGREGDSRPIIN